MRIAIAPRAPAREAGFTLVEMMVALALLALISIAGATLVNSVIGTRSRVQQRLDRLADLQRAMYLLDADLKQIAPAPIQLAGTQLTLARHAGRTGGGDEVVSYGLQGHDLVRTVNGVSQPLLSDVAALQWSFFVRPRGWRTGWPIDEQHAKSWPAAIAVDLTLPPGTGASGTLRRIVLLPSQS